MSRRHAGVNAKPITIAPFAIKPYLGMDVYGSSNSSSNPAFTAFESQFGTLRSFTSYYGVSGSKASPSTAMPTSWPINWSYKGTTKRNNFVTNLNFKPYIGDYSIGWSDNPFTSGSQDSNIIAAVNDLPTNLTDHKFIFTFWNEVDRRMRGVVDSPFAAPNNANGSQARIDAANNFFDSIKHFGQVVHSLGRSDVFVAINISAYFYGFPEWQTLSWRSDLAGYVDLHTANFYPYINFTDAWDLNDDFKTYHDWRQANIGIPTAIAEWDSHEIMDMEAGSATLSTAINATDTTLVISKSTDFPTINGTVMTLGSEQITIGERNGNTITGCTRGYNSTTAASHSVGTAITTADHWPPGRGTGGNLTGAAWITDLYNRMVTYGDFIFACYFDMNGGGSFNFDTSGWNHPDKQQASKDAWIAAITNSKGSLDIPSQTNTMTLSLISGMPDSTNTGVGIGPYAGITLKDPSIYPTPSGDSISGTGHGWTWTGSYLRVDSNGALVQNLDMTALNTDISVNGQTGVRILNCIGVSAFAGDGSEPALAAPITGRNGATVELGYCTLKGLNGTLTKVGSRKALVGIKDIYGDCTWNIHHCNIHWAASGMDQVSSGEVHHNYIHDLVWTGVAPGGFGEHNDGIQTQPNNLSMWIHHNTIFMGSSLYGSNNGGYPQTSPIILSSDDFSAPNDYVSVIPYHDYTIEYNLIAGGGYAMYGGKHPLSPATGYVQSNMKFRNNHFSRRYFTTGGENGPTTAFEPSAPGFEWSGNVWDDTLQIISSP